MKNALGIVTIVLLVAAALWIARGSVVYRGERVRLTVPLVSYDLYKNIPWNISLSEARRVQVLLRDAPVRKQYGSFRQLLADVYDLKFPGYGSGSIGVVTPDGAKLVLWSVEMPRAGVDRCLLFVELDDGSLELVDDVIGSPLIRTVVIENGEPCYMDRNQRVVHTTPTMQWQPQGGGA